MTTVSPAPSRTRRNKYHKIALKRKLASITEEEGGNEESSAFLRSITSTRPGREPERQRLINEAKIQIVCELAHSGGDSSTLIFQSALEKLIANYDPSHFDPRRLVSRTGITGAGVPKSTKLEGTWIALEKPLFTDCLGRNGNNDCMYTLGRMAFGKRRFLSFSSAERLMGIVSHSGVPCCIPQICFALPT
jgi:hypothetical protein